MHRVRSVLLVTAMAGAATAVVLGASARDRDAAPAAAPTTAVVAATTAPTSRTTATTTPATGPGPPTTLAPERCGPDHAAGDHGPVRADDPAVAAAVERFLSHPRVTGAQVSLSVTIAGEGEVVAVCGDLPLQTASVEKVATAVAVLERIEPAFAFETAVTSPAGAIGPDGALVGDLVLVAGGDPTLARSGPHSIETLADGVVAAGVRRVTGRLVVDTTRWDDRTAAPGWLDWHQPTYVGYLSALMVDQNRWQTGTDATTPGLAGGRLLADALGRRGVPVAGGVVVGASPGTALELVRLRSAARDALVQDMLTRSDNHIAEAFVHELGHRTAGVGSDEAGAAVVDEVLTGLSAASEGAVVADGAGISRLDRRSTRGWATLLTAAQGRPWWPVFEGGLPVAGRTGTLLNRFQGTPAIANLHAKSGTTAPVRALAGYATTTAGNPIVFAVVVNGTDADPPIDADRAIDVLLSDLLQAL